jgi:type II secretory pathway predicted ATPase ExeA
MSQLLYHFGPPGSFYTPDRASFTSARAIGGLAQLSYGIRARKGFVVLTGEVGTGNDVDSRAVERS